MVDRSNQTGELPLALLYFIKLYCFGCDLGPNIIASTISLVLSYFFTYTFIYTDTVSTGNIVNILLMVILYFGLVTYMGMITTYNIQMESKMNKIMKENLKLLDKMNEGLIMISE